MAVEIKCSICGKFIKEVEGRELKILTGKEICQECEKRLTSYLADLDNYVKQCKEEIAAEYQKTQEVLKKTEPVYKSYVERINGLFTTMKAEVNAKLDKILKP